MLRIGEFPLLEEVNQSGEIKSGTIPESAEKVGLKTRGRNIALTRQALINDDLGAFADMAAAAGRSAARTEDKVAFDGLLSNNGKGLKLADGKTLYHADHGNLAAAGAAISETTVDAGNQAIRFQKGIGDEVLDYSPAILLVGPKQELAARKFVAVVNAVSQDEFNPWAGRLRVEVTARITNNSWRLFTDPNELAARIRTPSRTSISGRWTSGRCFATKAATGSSSDTSKMSPKAASMSFLMLTMVGAVGDGSSSGAV